MQTFGKFQVKGFHNGETNVHFSITYLSRENYFYKIKVIIRRYKVVTN